MLPYGGATGRRVRYYTTPMKCISCKHLWYMPKCMDAPYGEFGCLKLECDLYDTQPADVENCEHYELKQPVTSE